MVSADGAVSADDVPIARVGWRGLPRRTWPQRFLLVAGLLVAAACFGFAWIFWQASVVLSEVPRISVGPDVLSATGDPGDPVNLLLVGIDSSEGLDPDDPVRVGRDVEDEERGIVRPDTILVARLDPSTGSASVLSLPRDLIVEVDGGATVRLNATQSIGGIGTLIETIDDNLAIPINHFIMIDFAGFSDIVDLVGGVPVYFPYPTRDVGSGLAIPDGGCFNLDGSQSLSYVRARSIEELIDDEWVALAGAAPDLARIERQQEFLVLTAEQILAVSRRDISRIGTFISAGTQAVQLDEQLTPGDMNELAAAFSDFDTNSLAISTLPVEPSFAEEGSYQGEAIIEDEAAQLLRLFQGQNDGVRPADVSIEVISDDDRHGTELAERGFDATSTAGEPVERTVVNFDPDTGQEHALLLARYLEATPQLVASRGVELTLEVGPDFAGVRVYPRAESDVVIALARAVTETTVAGPTETLVPPVAVEDGDDVLSTVEEADDQTTVAAQQAPSPLDAVVRGRPPEGIGCTTIGG